MTPAPHLVAFDAARLARLPKARDEHDAVAHLFDPRHGLGGTCYRPRVGVSAMIRWMAYAEIRFGESAHLALARAVEESGSEALAVLPDAWLIEERKVTLHIERDGPRADMIAVRQLLTALLREAEHGEAVVEVPPFERWTQHAHRHDPPRADGPRLRRGPTTPPPSDRTTVPLAMETQPRDEAIGSDREPDPFRA